MKKTLRSMKRDYRRAQQLHVGRFIFVNEVFNEGVERDLPSAVESYRALATAGFGPAQHWLGYCYLNGVGLEQDPERAVVLFKRAIEAGFVNALHCLGWCYSNGVGMEQDFSMAIECYEEAIGSHFSKSCVNLAWMNHEGQGVECNDSRAIELLELGVRYGLERPEGLEELGSGDVLVRREGLARNLIALAISHKEGRGVEVSNRASHSFYSRASLTGSGLGSWHLAKAYHDGVVIQKDLALALIHYRTCVDRGGVDAAAMRASTTRGTIQKLEAQLGLRAEVEPGRKPAQEAGQPGLESLRRLVYGPMTRAAVEEIHALLSAAEADLEPQDIAVMQDYVTGHLRRWPPHIRLCPDRLRTQPSVGANALWIQDASGTLARAELLLEERRYGPAADLLRPGLDRVDSRHLLHRIPSWDHPERGPQDGTRCLPVAGLASRPVLLWSKAEEVPRQPHDRVTGAAASALAIAVVRNDSTLTRLDPDSGRAMSITPTQTDFVFPEHLLCGMFGLICTSRPKVIDAHLDLDLYRMEGLSQRDALRVWECDDVGTSAWLDALPRTLELPFEHTGGRGFVFGEGLIVAWGEVSDEEGLVERVFELVSGLFSDPGEGELVVQITAEHIFFSLESSDVEEARHKVYRREDLGFAWGGEGSIHSVDEAGCLIQQGGAIRLLDPSGELLWGVDDQELRGLVLTPARVVCDSPAGPLLLDRSGGRVLAKVGGPFSAQVVAASKDVLYLAAGSLLRGVGVLGGEPRWALDLKDFDIALAAGVEADPRVVSLAVYPGRVIARSADGTVYTFAMDPDTRGGVCD